MFLFASCPSNLEKAILDITFPENPNKEIYLAFEDDSRFAIITKNATPSYLSDNNKQYIWYLDGQILEINTFQCIINSSSLSIGNHTIVVVVVCSNGNRYSASSTFKVYEETR